MRFNTKAESRNRTVNRAGGEAFVQDEKLALASLLLTSFASAQFYRSAKEQIDELAEMIANMDDKMFAAKAAVFARKEYGMRSISHAAAAEVAAQVKGQQWTKRFLKAVVKRPDDITETMAYYMNKYGSAVPNSMKKGFGAALSEFDEYQLGKYKATKAGVSLVDAVNLLHPKHTPALGKLMRGELKSPDTWEVGLTQAGQQAENEDDKKARKEQVWSELIESRKLGYFALLRNLRNIAEQAPESLDAALKMLVDERLIHKSLVLPFRYISAMDAIQEAKVGRARDIMVALSQAVDISLANVPSLDNTLIAVDVSGSMTWGDRVIKIASLFAAVLYKASDADMMLFDGHARYAHPNPIDSALSIAKWIEDRATGGSTNFRNVLETANKPYERVVFLSDMQGWVGWNAPTDTLEWYQRKYSAHPFIYSIDLAGYGTLQFPQERVFAMAGFSEKIFDVMSMLESDPNALINKIEQVRF